MRHIGQRIEAHATWLVFAIAALPRIGAWGFFPAPAPNYYFWLADSLLTRRTFAFGDEPTSFIEPLYPIFLAFARAVAPGERTALLIQALVSAAGAPAIYLLARRLSGSDRAGLVPATFYAFDPYFVRQAAAYIEVGFLLPLFLWALERFTAMRNTRDAAVTGALFGLLYLTRAALLPFCIGAIVVLLVRRDRGLAVVLAPAMAAAVMPWTIRSVGAGHGVAPTRIGENLFVSTSSFAVGVVPEYDVDLLVGFAQQAVDRSLGHAPHERDADRFLLNEAFAFVRAHPWHTLGLKLRNLIWIPSPILLPRNAKSEATQAVLVDGRVHVTGIERRPLVWEALHATFRTFVLGAAIVGCRRMRSPQDRLLLLVLASEALVYTAFFPTTRLLSVFWATLMIFAGRIGVPVGHMRTAQIPGDKT